MITYLCWPFLNLHFSAFDAEHILDSFLHFKVVKNNLATKFKRTRQFKRKLFSVFSTSILSAYFTTHGSSFFLHIQANSSRVPNFKLTSGRIHFCCHQTIQSLKLLQQQQHGNTKFYKRANNLLAITKEYLSLNHFLFFFPVYILPFKILTQTIQDWSKIYQTIFTKTLMINTCNMAVSEVEIKTSVT